jgi:hypothetical protein
MRQFLKSGSVRGVRSNPHPYRDPSTAKNDESHAYGSDARRERLFRIHSLMNELIVNRSGRRQSSFSLHSRPTAPSP